jgi:amino acid transporter
MTSDPMMQPSMQSSSPPETLQTELEEGAIGLLGATMQAITHIAPAIAGFFFTAFIVSLAGITAPLAYFIGFLIVLMLGSTLAQLAKHMPSAGGYYTYISRAIHPRAGFITSWMYILYSPIVGGPLAGFFGFIVAGFLKDSYGIDLPWLPWAAIFIFVPLTAYLQWEGIRISTTFIVITGGIEMLIVFALALSGFAYAPNGVSLEVFNPANIPVSPEGFFAGTFFLAVVFTVQGLTGWEASAPLAEETKDPRRNVPLSVMLSIVIIGSFLVIVFWGVISGFGNDADAVVNSPVLPALGLAKTVWGSADVIVLLAFLNSVAAVSVACANVGTRMWYSMARSGSFPKALAKVHPVHKTPTNAILLQMAFNLFMGVVGLLIFAPDVSFFFFVGLVLVLGVTVAYLLANLAVFLFYWREKRDEFNWILHFVFPLVSSLVLIYAIYKSFPQPDPYVWAPALDGVWLVIGILILVYLRARGNEEWLTKAGKSIGESV